MGFLFLSFMGMERWAGQIVILEISSRVVNIDAGASVWACTEMSFPHESNGSIRAPFTFARPLLSWEHCPPTIIWKEQLITIAYAFSLAAQPQLRRCTKLSDYLFVKEIWNVVKLIISLGLITIWFSFVLNAPVFRFNFFLIATFLSQWKVYVCLHLTFSTLFVCLLICFVWFYNCSVFLPPSQSVFPPWSFVFPFSLSVKDWLQVFYIKSSRYFFLTKPNYLLFRKI